MRKGISHHIIKAINNYTLDCTERTSATSKQIQCYISGGMMESLSKELSGIEVKINGLLSQKAVLKNKLKRKENSQRKARTRTLIQLGGLLNLTPLLSICSIELGDDLQLEHSDKAAMLLGMLSELSQRIPEEISPDLLEHYKNIGVRRMKEG